MKRALALTVLGSAVLWLVAQNVAPSRNLATYFPGGSLLYVEAKDLASLLRDWNTSPEKKLWLATDNYQVFSRSRLFLRLQEAQGEFAAAAGLPPDMVLLNSIAGEQSALAIYDIGELEFLYVTRLASARAMESLLLKTRSTYDARNAHGTPYYVSKRGQSKRVTAYAVVEGLLLLATREDLIANALGLHGNHSLASLPQDRWYLQAVQARPNAGEFRIVLNMAALVRNTYFRSYWIQRNSREMAQYSAGVIDVSRHAGELREERMLLREQPQPAPRQDSLAEALSWVPPDAGLYRTWTSPEVDHILQLVREKITDPGVQTKVIATVAPGESASGNAGNAADFETRIDQPPLPTEQKTAWVDAFRQLIEKADVRALAHVQSSRTLPDGVFVGNESALILVNTSAWPNEIRTAVPRAHVQVEGNTLILSNREGFVTKGTAPAANAGTVYTARYLHKRELAPYTRMMTMIEHQGDRADDGTPEPALFSDNIASLGRALGRLDSLTIDVRDAGSSIEQKVVYKWTP